ncbi:unnamed protein product [Ectocarpus sp. CCAP 1310/34]|nr:unnamed protein product [Ectocarpus sp. CCAP 1310/34]
MAKADVSDEEAQSQEAFGLLLIAVHVMMIIAILSQAYISMQANSELRDDLGSWLEKSNQNAPPADVAANGGRGGGDGDSIGSPVFSAQKNSGGWGEKQEEAAEAGGGGDGVAMWKHDRVGEAGGDDRAERGSSVGCEDVERRALPGPKRARGRRHKKNSCRSGGGSSADKDGDDDVIMEDSVELESVYSTSGKTSRIAGAFELPHRREQGRALSFSSVGLSNIDDSFLSSFAAGGGGTADATLCSVAESPLRAAARPAAGRRRQGNGRHRPSAASLFAEQASRRGSGGGRGPRAARVGVARRPPRPGGGNASDAESSNVPASVVYGRGRAALR